MMIRRYFQQNNIFSFLLNLMAMLGLLALAVAWLFGWYLPVSTHHGESLTVPDLRGLSLQEVERLLKYRDLEFMVADSGFAANQPMHTVLSQQPPAYEQVKLGRTIYLSVNSENAPMVEVPDILKNSLKNAEHVLESYGLRLGEVSYVPHHNSGQVLRVWVDSVALTTAMLEAGYRVRKNTQVDIAVGDGIGNVSIKVPKLVGRPADEAEIYLLGIGLHVGQLHWLTNVTVPTGTVLRQQPFYGEEARKGQAVDLWVASGY
jgi:eukaryotic-like serine/threonine-protein kinase